MVQISLQNVSRSFGSEVIFSDVTAKIEDHDRIGLVGPNGTGKTTLLRVICGELEPDDGSGEIARGADLSIGYQKQNCGLSFEGTIWQEMQSVFADVYALEHRMKELQERMAQENTPALAEEYRRTEDAFLARDGYQIEVKIKTVLTGMGFAEHGFDKCVDKLSGGEQTRLAIAKLLLEAPSLLILDEPTNHLDFATLSWLEDYLASYKGALLVVSHDRYFLDKLCNKIWELEDGTLWEYKGNYTAYTRQREEQDTRQKKLYEQQQAERAKLEDYVARNLVRASTTKMAQSRQKMLERLEPIEKPHRRLKPPKIRLEFETEPVKDVLDVEGLTIAVGSGERERILLANAEFNIQRGDKVAIIGPNGSGKTTLMKISAGLLQPTAGSVIIDKVPVGVFTKAVTSYLPDRMALPTEFTADDAVSLYADFFTDFDKVKANAMLADLHIGGRDKIDSMSKGTQEKMQLCLTMSRAARLYLLDEPLGGVDPAARDYILSTIMHNYSEDAALMLSTHLIGDIEKVLDEVILLQDGKVLRQTAVDELREETGESVDAYFREVYKC